MSSASNRDFRAENADHGYEIFSYDTSDKTFVQLTNGTNEHAALGPKISADGSRVYYKRTTATKPDTADLVLIEPLASRVIVADVPGLSVTDGRAISNDGHRIVYSALTGPNETQVFMFDSRDSSVRQLTELGSRSTDVPLQPTISGDGKRIAFATRRRVLNTSDGGVELYLLDLPTNQLQQITNAPATATAEVISSLNFDGSKVAFHFSRLLSGPVVDDDLRNNTEIYVATIPARPEFGPATVLNSAAQGREPQDTQIAPGSIATIRGNALAFSTESAAFTGSDPPFTVAGTSIDVNGHAARIFYASPAEVVFVVPDGLPNRPTEFVVTNSEGFSSKAVTNVVTTAPGIFTVAGDGRGEAVILNSDILTPGPFDPSSGQTRLSIFATGTKQAANVTVTIKGKPVVVETVTPARLRGIDEIHVLLPADLAGAGTSTLIVTAGSVRSNSVSMSISGKLPTPTPTPVPSPSPSPMPSPIPSPSPDSAPRLVISQIFGGGGNSGAPFRNDFIEIFNNGSSAVNLAGWSVQYASATASTWSVTPLTAVTLLPGQYYLIQESSGGTNGVVLPAPDALGTIAMAAGSGKVALVKNATALSGACPNDPNLVDMVGYGSTANCFRGSAPAPAQQHKRSAARTKRLHRYAKQRRRLR